MSKFRDLGTQVKINPETYLRFDGSEQVVLQNIYCEDAVRIKYDIMLILYDLVDWRSVGDLIAPWPPDDQEKIIDSLDKLYIGKIVMCSDDTPEEKNESGLPEFLGNRIHINVENHYVMLKDYVRMAAYRRAIERAVKPDSIVMDLGCGSGVLSFFAAQAGAKKIYAIEKRPDIILLAEELAKVNGFSQIEFIEGASSMVKDSQVTPKANLLISEILGNGILEENVLEFTLDARDRLLAPDAQMIPFRLDIYVFAFDSGMRPGKQNEIDEFKDLYGIDFTLLGQVLDQKTVLSLERYNPALHKHLSKPVVAKSLDFRTLHGGMFNQEFTLDIEEDGNMTGFCAYFKAYLDEETTLTNSPWAPQTHWTHLIYSLPNFHTVKKGDKLPMDIVYDGVLRIRQLEE